MKFKALVAALALAGFGLGAQAAVQTSTSGNVTTYTDNGGDFGKFGDLLYTDNYLWVSSGSNEYSLSFQVASTSDIDLSFWYSMPFGAAGTVTLTNLLSAPLSNTTGTDNVFGSGFRYGANNPGPDSAVLNSNHDRMFSGSFSNVAAGSYTLTIAATQGGAGGILPWMKLDDVSVKVTATVPAVPEPESYAMLLAGLGLVGAVARRRRQGN